MVLNGAGGGEGFEIETRRIDVFPNQPEIIINGKVSSSTPQLIGRTFNATLLNSLESVFFFITFYIIESNKLKKQPKEGKLTFKQDFGF